MMRLREILALLTAVLITAPVLAQGSFADRELNKIRGQATVRNNTVESLNKSTLRGLKGTVPNVGQSGAGRATAGTTYTASNVGSSEPTSKPFSNVRQTPTVSPYLNLFREDLDGNSDLNYQTLVRPQLEQQQINQQVQRQALDSSRRIQALSARADFSPQGSRQQSPTGHSTAFFNYSHYYPTGRRR
jgi:hypothetical protein